ncbi:MAG: hypothetical protein ACI4NP_02135 [Thermoguttaceae bacterium]
MANIKEKNQLTAKIIVVEDEIESEAPLFNDVMSIRRALERMGLRDDYFTLVRGDSEKLVDVLLAASERVDVVLYVGSPQSLREVLVEQVVPQLTASGYSSVNGYSFSSSPKDAQGVSSTGAISAEDKTVGILLLKTICKHTPLQDSRLNENASYLLVAFPSLPSNLDELLEDHSLQSEIRRFVYEPQSLATRRFQTKRLHAFGLDESSIERLLGFLKTQHPSPAVRISSHDGVVTLLIVAEGETETECAVQVHEMSEIIYRKIGRFIFGEDCETFQEVFGRNLRAQARKVGLLDWGTQGTLTQVVDADILAYGMTFGAGERERYERFFANELFVSDPSPLSDDEMDSALNVVASTYAIGASEIRQHADLGRYPDNIDYLLAISPRTSFTDMNSPKQKVDVVFVDLREPQTPLAYRETYVLEESKGMSDVHICYCALNLLLKRQ